MPVRRWLVTVGLAAGLVLAVVLLAGGKSDEERRADDQRCAYESIVGVNTSAGELTPEARARIRELQRNAKDCKEP